MLGNEALYEAALSERGYILAAAPTFPVSPAASMGREASVSPLRSIRPHARERDARPGANRFRADSLFGRINSLFSANRFPVLDELIPCSPAQGISSRGSRKSLDSQMFSGRIFASNQRNPGRFAVPSLL
jgi:hypothetical protein